MELFLGFYFGTLSMIILYNFHWYNVTKEKSYLYYALFKLSLILILLQLSQIIATNKFFEILNANIIFMLIFLFSKEFLSLKIFFKTINKIINYVMLFVLLCFAYSIIIGSYTIFDQPYSLILAPLILMGYFVYQRGFDPAKYYVLAWGISVLLIGLDDLNTYAIVEFYPEVPFTLMGHIIESIILSYAISLKTKLIIKEKEQQSNILIHQAKLASMGQMLENISHQWRQPLNRIAAFIVNMQAYIKGKYKNETYLIDTLNQAQLQLEYMSDTINDFTNFNRHSRDKECFLASLAIENAYDIIDKTLEKNNILFELKINNDFSINSYPSELTQIILNLIQNAQDALIKRQVNQAFIKIVIDSNKISVQDNAGGINPKIAEHIFEPYFSTKSNTSSLGLGLYMSKIILDKYFNAKIEMQQTEAYTSFDILFNYDGASNRSCKC